LLKVLADLEIMTQVARAQEAQIPEFKPQCTSSPKKIVTERHTAGSTIIPLKLHVFLATISENK
jgi:hypothetical protein